MSRTDFSLLCSALNWNTDGTFVEKTQKVYATGDHRRFDGSRLTSTQNLTRPNTRRRYRGALGQKLGRCLGREGISKGLANCRKGSVGLLELRPKRCRKELLDAWVHANASPSPASCAQWLWLTDTNSPDARFKIQLVSSSKLIIYTARRDKTAKLTDERTKHVSFLLRCCPLVSLKWYIHF